MAVRSGFLVSRYMPALVTEDERRDFFKGVKFKGDGLPVFRGPGNEFPLTQLAYGWVVQATIERTK